MRRRFMKKSKPKTYTLTIQTKPNSTININGQTKTSNSSGIAYFDLEKGDYEYSIVNSSYMLRNNIVSVQDNTTVTETNLNPITWYYASIYIYNSDGTYGSSPGSNPIGIYIDCSESSFILSLKCFGRGYGDANNRSVTALQDTAIGNVLSDFNGKSNFRTMVNNSSYPNNTSYVLGTINSFSDGNIGAGQWYLPSGGQIGIVKQYYGEIISACNRCGFYPNIGHIIYTSTRCSRASYNPHETTSKSVFAPDIYNSNPINERIVRFDQWSNIYYWAAADKP